VHSRLKIRGLVFSLLILATCSPAFGMSKARTARHSRVRSHAHRSRISRILWNPLFRPSHESLLRQNEEIDRLDLPRIQDDDELERLKLSGDLVPIEPGQTLRIDPRLDPDRRFCRPWTRDFVTDLSAAYYKQFHDQIQVNSAVRTVQVQKKLRRHNRNAAPETGDTASSHLAGITVDLQRRGMTKAEIKWVEQYIVPLRDAGWSSLRKSATNGSSTLRFQGAMPTITKRSSAVNSLNRNPSRRVMNQSAFRQTRFRRPMKKS